MSEAAKLEHMAALTNKRCQEYIKAALYAAEHHPGGDAAALLPAALLIEAIAMQTAGEFLQRRAERLAADAAEKLTAPAGAVT